MGRSLPDCLTQCSDRWENRPLDRLVNDEQEGESSSRPPEVMGRSPLDCLGSTHLLNPNTAPSWSVAIALGWGIQLGCWEIFYLPKFGYFSAKYSLH
uniref:Uncharacterized protein n=1 Tax=Lutzomyia longipalpis TaxID=7200 RepID=A0A1B0CQC3_LUTLO